MPSEDSHLSAGPSLENEKEEHSGSLEREQERQPGLFCTEAVWEKSAALKDRERQDKLRPPPPHIRIATGTTLSWV